MPELRAEITGDASGLVRAARRARTALNKTATAGVGFGKKLVSAFGAVVSAAKQVVKVLGGITAAVVGIGVAAVASFAKFQSAFAQVRTLIDASDAQVKRLSDGVRDLSVAFGVDAIEATKAAYQAISAGVEQGEVLEFLETAFKGAAAGAATTAETVDALTTVLNAFGKDTKEAGRVSDVLFATIKAGKTTMSELAASLGQVAPIAAANGVSFEEMSAALATTTKSGLSTAEAATALKAVIVGIVKPSKDASVALEGIGVTAETLRKPGGLADAMGKIRMAVKQGNAEITTLLPNIRAMNAGAILAGEGFEEFNRILGETNEATGAAEEAFGKASEGLGIKFNKLKQTGIDAFRSLGEALVPVATKLIAIFGKFAETSRSEFKALQVVLERRSASMNESMDKFGKKVNSSGGLVTLTLKAVAASADALTGTLDLLVRPVAGAVAGFDLLLRVMKLTASFVALNFVAAFAVTVNVLSLLVEGILEAAAALTGLVSDEKAKKIRNLRAQFTGFRQQVTAFTKSLAESTVESAKNIGGFTQTFQDVAVRIQSAKRAVAGFGSEARKLGNEVAVAKAEADALAKKNAEAAGSANALGKASQAAAPGIAGFGNSMNFAAGGAANLAARAREAGKAVEEASRIVKASEFVLAPGEAARILPGGEEVEIFSPPAVPGLRPQGTPQGSRQLGGPIASDGTFALHRGEFVLSRPAAEGLGPALLSMLNQARPVEVGGVTINAGGRGDSLRDEARALLPDLERALRRGLSSGSGIG